MTELGKGKNLVKEKEPAGEEFRKSAGTLTYVWASQVLQHCRSCSANSCSHTCGTEEELSPLILALVLGMKIKLTRKPGGCLCQRFKSSQASALCLHTVNFRVSLWVYSLAHESPR